MKKRNLKEKGITLVALVVTIIILLILAGVAIASITGDNGLFRKAREATNVYKDSERDEQGVLGEAENELSKLLNPSGNGGGSGDGPTVPTGYVTGNTPVTVTDGTYYIPDGFKLAEDSGTTINAGIVVEDKNRNQWVWIPCYVDGGVGADVEGRVKYDRYTFGSQMFDPEDSSKIKPISSPTYHFTESLNPTDEASIRQFGGYYIGRYEAGDGTVTSADTPRLRTSSDVITNTVTIKKGQAPYNWIKQSDCVTLSNGIATANNYNTSKMYTKICSSYAWDTALKFIGGNYETDSTQGNYKNVTFSYKDISGASQTKNNGDKILIPTGQTTAIKNIYDMGGNVWEYISETFTDGSASFVARGGHYGHNSSDCPAGFRGYDDGYARSDNSFRPTLYLSNT